MVSGARAVAAWALGTRLGEDRDDVDRVRISSVSQGLETSMVSWMGMMFRMPVIPQTSLTVTTWVG